MKRVIIWVLYILMGVQIALGCAYFISNFGEEQQFRENLVSFLPAGVVYLMQLILAAVSVWYVLGKFGLRRNKYVRGYVCAFFLTVPFLLQMHLARLIWSAGLSAFLWLLGLILEMLESGLSRRRVVLLLIAWFLYGILCPDGLWLGGGLLLAAVFFYKRKEKSTQKNLHRGICIGLAALFTAGVIFVSNMGLNSAFPEARKIYRENTVGTAVISRFVWPNFANTYYFWSEDVKELLSMDDAVELSQRIDLVGEKFYPNLEKAYGKKKAIMLCVDMGYSCVKVRTRETVSEIARDFEDYFLLPFTIERNLRGEGTSLTAWNYGRMREHTPILVKYYYRYGTFELPFLLLGSFLLWFAGKNDDVGRFLKQRVDGVKNESGFNRQKDSKKYSVPWKFLLFIWILYTVWYTVRSNLPIDYKMALQILFIWYLASVAGLFEKN